MQQIKNNYAPIDFCLQIYEIMDIVFFLFSFFFFNFNRLLTPARAELASVRIKINETRTGSADNPQHFHTWTHVRRTATRLLHFEHNRRSLVRN